MNNKWYIVILVGLGLFTHFLFFDHPNETVFDEVHFGKFISGYNTREYFFDIHPPLGKLMIAGFAKIFGFEPGFSFAEIGNKFPDKQYLILRFLPNLAGSLLPLVIYLLLLEIGVNPLSSFFGGLLIVFENALLVQSHYILLDAFLLLFGFSALLFYFKYKNLPPLSARYFLLFGLFSGLAMSVKWTGLSFLALPLLIEFVNMIRTKKYSRLLTTLPIPLGIALLAYFLIFSAHLIILNKSGPGDAFMNIGFQKTLAGSAYANNPTPPPNFLQKFIELNSEMYKANQQLQATHPYSSKWYTWPFMTRPIFYWVEGDQRIYLLGNPVIWWLSTVAVLCMVLSILYSKLINRNSKLKTSAFAKASADKQNSIPFFLLAAYVVNMLPFIGVKRVMFLYHYFTAYIFAIIMMVWLIDQHGSTSLTARKNANGSKWLTTRNILAVLLTASVVAFIYFAPLSYGLNLSPKAYNARIWLSSWI